MTSPAPYRSVDGTLRRRGGRGGGATLGLLPPMMAPMSNFTTSYVSTNTTIVPNAVTPQLHNPLRMGMMGANLGGHNLSPNMGATAAAVPEKFNNNSGTPMASPPLSPQYLMQVLPRSMLVPQPLEPFVSVIFHTGSQNFLVKCALRDNVISTSAALTLPLNVCHCLVTVLSVNMRMSDADVSSVPSWNVQILMNNHGVCDVPEPVKARNLAQRFLISGLSPVGFLPITQLQVTTIPMTTSVCSGTHPDEKEMVRCVVEVMCDPGINPRKGSMTQAHLLQVLQMRYPAVVEAALNIPKVNGMGHAWTFSEFLKRHEDKFSLFVPSGNEIRQRQLTVRPDEARITLRLAMKKGHCSELDAMPPDVRDDILSIIYTQLTRQTTPLRNLLQLIGDRRLRRHLCQTFSTVMRVLRRRDEFWWSTDPSAPIRIGLLRGAATDDPSSMSPEMLYAAVARAQLVASDKPPETASDESRTTAENPSTTATTTAVGHYADMDDVLPISLDDDDDMAVIRPRGALHHRDPIDGSTAWNSYASPWSLGPTHNGTHNNNNNNNNNNSTTPAGPTVSLSRFATLLQDDMGIWGSATTATANPTLPSSEGSPQEKL